MIADDAKTTEQAHILYCDGQKPKINSLSEEISALKKENERLRKALEKYGIHKYGCDIHHCTCGLKEALFP